MNGDLPSSEVWSTGLHVQTAITIDAVATAWTSAVTALWTGSGSAGIFDVYPTVVAVRSLDVFQLDPASDVAVAKVEVPVTLPGGSGANTLPQEVAVCATLRSNTPGPRGRGRMFFPPPTVTEVTPTGRLNTVAQQSLAIGIALMLQAMEDVTATPVLHTKGGIDRLITRVDVGDVFDAQRRRRDALIEARYAGPALTRAANAPPLDL
jgi:hypothetical protein